MAELKTQGTEIYLLDETDSGNEVRKIGKITGGSGVGGEASEIDKTNLDSEAMEFLTGLTDNGSVSADMNWDPQDESHQTIDSLVGGDNKRFLICGSESDTQPTYGSDFDLPTDRTVLDFEGGIRGFPKDFSTNDIWRGSVTIRVSGAITITPAS